LYVLVAPCQSSYIGFWLLIRFEIPRLA
jgi:hypothetical protein